MKTKEQVYDEQIYPLIVQSLGLCRQHGIQFLAISNLGNHNGENMMTFQYHHGNEQSATILICRAHITSGIDKDKIIQDHIGNVIKN